MMPVNLRPTNSKPLYLIDAIGPFFRGLKRKTINWSKIPFDHLGIDDSTGTHQQWAQIQTDLEIIATKTRCRWMMCHTSPTTPLTRRPFAPLLPVIERSFVVVSQSLSDMDCLST